MDGNRRSSLGVWSIPRDCAKGGAIRDGATWPTRRIGNSAFLRVGQPVWIVLRAARS
jgi:hypothetical protein